MNRPSPFSNEELKIPRAAAPIEILEKSHVNPRDAAMDRIVRKIEETEAAEAPGTVLYAYLSWKKANGVLWRALTKWVSTIPCRFYWHAPFPNTEHSSHGLKTCRRCGAWRPDR